MTGANHNASGTAARSGSAGRLQVQGHSQRQGRLNASCLGALGALLAAGLALTGCDIDANEQLMRQGHQAMVQCQHAERAITDGDELRCEDWDYVRSTYLLDSDER